MLLVRNKLWYHRELVLNFRLGGHEGGGRAANCWGGGGVGGSVEWGERDGGS